MEKRKCALIFGRPSTEGDAEWLDSRAFSIRRRRAGFLRIQLHLPRGSDSCESSYDSPEGRILANPATEAAISSNAMLADSGTAAKDAPPPGVVVPKRWRQ